MEQIEVYPDSSGGWRFRVKAKNGEIVAGGESYATQPGALEGVNALKRALGLREVWGVRYDAYDPVSGEPTGQYHHVECGDKDHALALLEIHNENDAEAVHPNNYPDSNARLIRRFVIDWEETN